MTKAQRWSMLAAILGSAMVFLDGTVMNLALPRDRRGAAGARSSRRSRARRTPSRGYLAILAALLVLAGRPRRLLRPAADLRHRPHRVRHRVASCAASRPPSSCSSLFRLLQGATGALLVPGSLAILTALFEGQARARAFGIWASATSATSLIGPVVGGLLVDTRELAGRVPDQRPARARSPCSRRSATCPRRRPRAPRAASTGWARSWRSSPSAGSRSGRSAARTSSGRTRSPGSRWRSAPIALIAFPILMARRPNPLVPLGLFRRRRFATINLSTLLIYGALYTIALFQGLFLQNTVGYTATAAGIIGLPTGIILTLFSARVGSAAGRIGMRPFLVIGPIIMASGLFWFARVPVDDRALGSSQLGDPSTLAPAAVHARRRPAVRPAVRGRDHARRRAADDDAHGARSRWRTPGSRRRSTTRSAGSGSRCSRR